MNVPETLQHALTHHQAGRLTEAEQLYRAVLAAAPDHFDALHLLGLVETRRGHFVEAERLLARARSVNPRSAEACSNHVHALMALGRVEEALASCDAALANRPDFPEAHYNRGVALVALQRYDDALASYDRALSLRPDFAQAHADRGAVLATLGRYDEALQGYDRALALGPGHVPARYNRGVALAALARPAEALACFDEVLAREPGHVLALNNRGGALDNLRRHAQAKASYDRALAIQPDFADALYNRGALHAYGNRHDAACADLERAFALDPGLPYLDTMLLHSRMHCCDWRACAEQSQRLVARVRSGARGTDPLTMLAVSDSAADQLRCARTWVDDKCPPSPARVWRGERYRHERIRIAYLSADLRDHPLAWLMAGLFERHDRERFETTAISFGDDAPGAMRSRLQRAFARFVDVRSSSDREVADLLRELEIDIAVDLNGHTADARTGILALRPAPIQVNYLGFPGTLGADYIDYILADRFVIPQAQQAHYAEEVVYLPDTFQANDTRRPQAGRSPSRAEAGLPGEGMVLCSFNSSYKIAPAMFDVWMRLLRQIDGSVLWLAGGNASLEANLRRDAQVRGVAPARLVFAPRAAYAEYLARCPLADLVLDTLPFNGGTTTSDALWAGVPVLTCAGEAFAARMAGSLLTAIGLPELVTSTLDAYEALALRLAGDPALLAATRQKLARNRDTSPLFDTDRFRRSIEAAYTTMWERHQRGEGPHGAENRGQTTVSRK